MALDAATVCSYANQMNSKISDLRQAKSKLTSYKSALSTNWKGTEIYYITSAIDKSIRDIDAAISQISSTKTEIVNTANQIREAELAEEERIRKEQEEAERKAAEEEAERAASSVAKIGSKIKSSTRL